MSVYSVVRQSAVPQRKTLTGVGTRPRGCGLDIAASALGSACPCLRSKDGALFRWAFRCMLATLASIKAFFWASFLRAAAPSVLCSSLLRPQLRCPSPREADLDVPLGTSHDQERRVRLLACFCCPLSLKCKLCEDGTMLGSAHCHTLSTTHKICPLKERRKECSQVVDAEVGTQRGRSIRADASRRHRQHGAHWAAGPLWAPPGLCGHYLMAE